MERHGKEGVAGGVVILHIQLHWGKGSRTNPDDYYLCLLSLFSQK